MFAYLNIQTLTSRDPSDIDIRQAINSFVDEFGWKPSFAISERGVRRITNANVLLEQGLEVSAMVSFLRDRDFNSLTFTEIKNLLEISYNNLVDWHIFVDQNYINIKFNRNIDSKPIAIRINSDDVDPLYYKNIDRLISKTLRSDIDPLDLEIIGNIARYRRLIHTEIEGVGIEDISSLMNSVILLRSMEDISSQNFIRLSDSWYRAVEEGKNLSDFIGEQAELRNNNEKVPEFLLELESIKIFNSCSSDTIYHLFNSFYGNRQYKYDFSLMTKHALGKIYEKYVTELEIIKTTQVPLFEGLLISSERRSYAGGTVYTPQYIASYFSRLALEYVGQKALSSVKVADPACGSGVFLRNYMEKALESSLKIESTKKDIAYFDNIYGIDINKNAANSSKLSLSLLSLSVFNILPSDLKIFNVDSLSKLPEYESIFDLLFCNPPYESSDELSDIEKVNHIKVLGSHKTGTKFDSYLAFLILSVRSLKPGGYGFFVLPQTFLSNAFADGIRKFISENCRVHRIVDLSSINDVFSNVSTYVILLVIQKKIVGQDDELLTQIVQAKSFPGYALEYSLDRREVDNEFVKVFYRDYENFSKDWRLISQAEDDLLGNDANLINASAIFDIQQGVLSGADDIFILSSNSKIDQNVSVKYLPDRGMTRYSINSHNIKSMLYPYTASTTLLPIDSIRRENPSVAKYLESNKEKLISRAEKDESNWWGFTRPRKRLYFERPKIISPNLVISPKFSADLSGGIYVSRSTYLVVKDSIYKEVGESIALEILKFYLGILNSSIYYRRIQSTARKYRGSYIKIEVKTLKESLLPDYFSVERSNIELMVSTVDKMISEGETEIGRNTVEMLAAKAYGGIKN